MHDTTSLIQLMKTHDQRIFTTNYYTHSYLFIEFFRRWNKRVLLVGNVSL